MWINAEPSDVPNLLLMEWHPIKTAPFGVDLELATISSSHGMQALVFPCRRDECGWVNAETNMPVKVYPTHWREWREPAFSPRRH